jgi:hypothetical protein
LVCEAIPVIHLRNGLYLLFDSLSRPAWQNFFRES